MAQLASEMQHIKSFLHVSTAYVNCHLGRNKHVEEKQYLVSLRGGPVEHAQLIQELLDLAPDEAERRVSLPLLRCLMTCPSSKKMRMATPEACGGTVPALSNCRPLDACDAAALSR
jgi:hypothetical protein